ncbi:hypothetical protein BASA81_005362 [Batrachochytrium salamandrivorans]|nr:hypothetical protein BASA81_005362 [Batrachochytrium salamandrivorans]
MKRLFSSTGTSRSVQAKTNQSRQHVRWAARRGNLLPKALTVSPHYHYKRNPFTFDDANASTAAPESFQSPMSYAQRFWPVSATAHDFTNRQMGSGTFFGHVGPPPDAQAMRCEP